MNYIVTALLIVLVNGCGPMTRSEKNSNRSVPEINKPKKAEEPLIETVKSVDSAAQNLLDHQQKNFDRILKELKDNKKKTSHWIWWVFPTEVPGQSEPSPKSSVAVSQAQGLLSRADIEKWTKILQLIASFLEAHPLVEDPLRPNGSIIPAIDHGRIAFALDFWLNKVQEKTLEYDSFYQAWQRLNKFKWR